MKIFVRLFTVILVIGLFIGLSGFSSGENNAAGLNKDFGCWFVDGGGNWYLSYEHNLSVSNHGGNVTLICRFSDVPVPVDRVVTASGFRCYIGPHITYNSSYQLTPGGEGLLKCFVKKQEK